MSTSGTPHVALLAPMRPELAAVVRVGQLERHGSGPLRVHAGTAGGTKVSATMIGVGPALAREATARVLQELQPDWVLVVGVSGGLSPDLEVGAIVVPEVVLDQGTGQEWRPNPLPGTTAHGLLATCDGLISDDTVLAGLAERGCIALDMEASGVAEACAETGCPWSMVRCISDRPADGLVDQEVFHLTRADGTPDLAAVARLLARHPGRVRDLMRLGRDLKTATTAAARTALDACAALAGAAA